MTLSEGIKQHLINVIYAVIGVAGILISGAMVALYKSTPPEAHGVLNEVLGTVTALLIKTLENRLLEAKLTETPYDDKTLEAMLAQLQKIGQPKQELKE